jgi:hypothetical protein
VNPRSGGTVLVLVLEGTGKGIEDENEDDDDDDAWARGDDRIGGETRRTRRPSLSPLARLRLNAPFKQQYICRKTQLNKRRIQ